MLNFDPKRLKEVLKAFYISTGARVAIYNVELQELASYPQAPCQLCTALRKVEEIDAMCRMSDRKAFEICRETGEMFSYRCRMGLYEAIRPITLYHNVEGYIMMGQVLSSKKEVLNNASLYIEETEDIYKEIKNALGKMGAITFEKVESIAFLMNMCVEYLCMNNVILKSGPRAVKIDEYIEEHIDEKLYADHIAAAFYISRATLHNIVKDAYNMSLTERINYLRIMRAKQYLLEGQSVDMICVKIGYNEKSYFYKNFKKYTGGAVSEYLFDCNPRPRN
ncbi:MAG: PocR ligand-binding domain-containing protein [Eubacteriales bacterium]